MSALSSLILCISHSPILVLYARLISMQEVAEIAQWEDEQIEYIKEKVTEEGKEADLKKGKAPAQVLILAAQYLPCWILSINY